MITTDFMPGSPCWIEVSSPDVDVSGAFYREVFGWEAAPPAPESGGYVLLRLDGAVVGGLHPRWTESERPTWTIYFADPDVDDTIITVERLGGTLLVEPFDVWNFGRTAQFFDPQGASFGLWQAERVPGIEVTDRPGSLCWVELWTPDGEGSREFYTRLFKWGVSDFELPGEAGTYTVLTPPGAGRERAHGGLMAVDPAHLSDNGGSAEWHPVFAVVDCDLAAERVRTAGGEVYMGPEHTPGVGRLAVCSDPFQAGFVLLQPSPD
ncbi:MULTISPECIES: VOC family protein [unclassified Nocardiopsis]|uniref:VOC family protein n=1 Tax=unclassified Nocardiopsis TaxID=2649073 RepID=UPI0013589BFC|nr:MULTISPECIES: VOC family protein [unclassified Nocardiopsis]